MNASQKPTASVTASGVVAIAGSVLTLLGTTLVLFAFLLMPTSKAGPQLPSITRNLMVVVMTFFVGLAIFGIFTGVGLLRLKNWARISTLIWSGITAAIGILTVVFVALMPFPTPPNTSVPENLAALTRIVAALFYGTPAGIAIWWLLLFNRKEIAAQFVPTGVASLDASGFPVEMTSTSRPPLPLPIAVLAVFLMLSSLSLFFLFFVPVPILLFGHAFHGPSGTTLLIVSCLVSTAAGIGLLFRKSWSYSLTLGLQVLWFLSGLVTVLSPKFPDLMREMMSSMMFSASPPPEYSIEQMRRMSLGSLFFPALIAILLIYYRGRFLEASAWRKPGT
jgi:hypothetical protein